MTAPPPPGGKPPLTPLRLFFAVISVLLMLFGGGCGLYFAGLGVFGMFEGEEYALALVIMGPLLGGVPAALGYVIWWSSVKIGRE